MTEPEREEPSTTMNDPAIFTAISPPGRFAPLDGDDPAIRHRWNCPGCGEPFEAGQRPALVNPLPHTAHDLLRAIDGRPYTATVSLAHEACAYPEVVR